MCEARRKFATLPRGEKHQIIYFVNCATSQFKAYISTEFTDDDDDDYASCGVYQQMRVECKRNAQTSSQRVYLYLLQIK